MSVHPLRDFIAISKDEAAKTTSSGLFIPTNVEEKTVTGRIVAVGSGRIGMTGTVVPLEVCVNDKVVFNKHVAVEVKDGDDTVWVLREDQILCILR